MAIRMQDLGEIVYGGAVTLTEWWDDRRITEGKIARKDILRKASFYTYLVVGLPATLCSAFGWWRRQETWMEHISHGFLYDVPRFIKNIVQDMGTQSKSSSAAIQEAQKILRQRQLSSGKSTGVPGRSTGVPVTTPMSGVEPEIIVSST